MKRFHMIFVVIIMAALLLTGCDGKTVPTSPANTDDQTNSVSENIGWGGYFGTLTRQTSGQYSSATLQVKELDDSVVLFEIDMMEGVTEPAAFT